ncbi:MAG: ATP-binding protein [Cyanobacteria bacterium P01_D01_bin.14]
MSANSSDFCSLSFVDRAIVAVPLVVTPETRVADVIARMHQAQTSYVLVAEQQRPVGLLTERDVVRLVASACPMADVAISTVMTRDFKTLTADEVTPALWPQMQPVGHTPIVDAVGRLVGVVTPSSLLRAMNPVATPQQMEGYLQEAYVQLEHSHNEQAIADEELNVTLQELQAAELQLVEKAETLDQLRQLAERDQQRYQDLFDFAPDGYLVTDRAGTILEANQAAARLLAPQQGRNYLIGLPLRLFVSPSQLPRFRGGLSQVKPVGQIHSFEIDLRPSQQTDTLTAAVKLSRIALSSDPSESAEGILWLIRDITPIKQAQAALKNANTELEARVVARTSDLRQAEHRWRTLLDNVHLAVVGLDAAGGITYTNPFFLEMTGYTADEVMGQNWFARFLPQSQHPQVKHYFQQLGSQPDTPLRYRNTILTRSGEARVIDWNNTPLRNGQGLLTGTMSIGEDVTDRLAMDRIRDEFLSIVSHELRTPLTTIYGGLRLVTQGIVSSESERGQQLLQIAADSSQRLVRLVDDILTIERLESGQSSLHKRPCNTQDLTRSVADTFKLVAEPAGIDLVVSDPGVELVADCDRISQVLTNLVDNAIKFSPAKTTIQLTVEPVEAEEQSDRRRAVLFKLRDQGRGIPPQKLSNIFDRFIQVDSSDARQKGGTGLGLAICRNIVEQHGGGIWVESALGQGSCFCFTLPVD